MRIHIPTLEETFEWREYPPENRIIHHLEQSGEIDTDDLEFYEVQRGELAPATCPPRPRLEEYDEFFSYILRMGAIGGRGLGHALEEVGEEFIPRHLHAQFRPKYIALPQTIIEDAQYPTLMRIPILHWDTSVYDNHLHEVRVMDCLISSLFELGREHNMILLRSKG